MAKEIALTQGKVAIVDDDDYDRLAEYKWYAHKNRTCNLYYAMRQVGTAPNQKCIRMHRVVANAPDGVMVDHKDGDSLNNRKANLRLCTHGQNIANRRRKGKNKSSQYTGVTWRPDNRKWRAGIKGGPLIPGTNRRKNITLGHFDSEVEAAHAYDDMAVIVHGEFACLNFPKRKRNGTAKPTAVHGQSSGPEEGAAPDRRDRPKRRRKELLGSAVGDGDGQSVRR